MIHFAIGTKAQFIKMAPIMHLLQKSGEPYHLLDLSQHGSLTGKILENFSLSPVTTRLGRPNVSVTTYSQAIAWFSRGAWLALTRQKKLRERLFRDSDGVVLLHGDTLSTLLGMYLAKGAQLTTGLVEAGLSSGRYFDPFPEEWIRRYVSKRMDFLFPPDHRSAEWLRQKNMKGRIVPTAYNTGRDAMQIIMATPADSGDRTPAKYGVATLHRLETISSARRMRRAIRHIISLSESLGQIKFYMHPPTERSLIRSGLMPELVAASKIEIIPLQPYPVFIHSLKQAEFVLTDGGSIQEEASYLNKPCIILRYATERHEGVGRNAALTTWKTEDDSRFLLTAHKTPDSQTAAAHLAASHTILESLHEFRVR
jgi:UDP-N-acetylglucosamine 2-epimerase (non-hydrolysing)